MTSTRYWDTSPTSWAQLGLEPTHAAVLIYDEVLGDNEAFGELSASFDLRYPVEAGESLKDLDAFPRHVAEILRMLKNSSRAEMLIVAAGGGSVGDFAGFLASVLKRGVGLVHMPTTWLSAMDSAHGGKTGLNVGGVKNQIGTFHSADETWIIKPLLSGVPEAEMRSACGELLKMAMLAGGELFDGVAGADRFDADELWALLPGVVEAKMAVVAEDPRETTGRRQILNFGHTFGHALEAHHRLAHGVAVGCGLWFALEWSMRRGYLPAVEGRELVDLVERFPEFTPQTNRDRALGSDELVALLAHDKKAVGDQRVRFVFLDGVGSPRLEAVGVGEVAEEAVRQGWL